MSHPVIIQRDAVRRTDPPFVDVRTSDSAHEAGISIETGWYGQLRTRDRNETHDDQQRDARLPDAPAADQQFTIENVFSGEQPRIDGLAVSY